MKKVRIVRSGLYAPKAPVLRSKRETMPSGVTACENRAAGRRVAQRLCALQIFLPRNIPEFAAVLGVVLLEQPPRAESGPDATSSSARQQQSIEMRSALSHR